MTRPPTVLAFAVAAVQLACAAAAQTPPALSASERTEHFVVHFRPGSRSEAEVDRIVAVVEGDLARILGELGLKTFAPTIDLHLYDDTAELQRLTGVPSGGHSTTLQSHVPCDNDQTRVHELVHVVAEQFPERGDEPRNLFFAEGLANAVLRFVDGVSIDAVAAFYRQRGQLPGLAEVQEQTDFYAWMEQHPGLNAYDIAASWMRFLLDTFGAAKVRAYYKGVAPNRAFGADLATLERRWHAHLDQVQLRPGTIALLTRRAATTAAARNPNEAQLDERVLGAAAEWHAVAADALQDGAPAAWRDAAFALDGAANVGDWCLARFALPVGDAIVRCTASAKGSCFGVQVQFGERCQGLLLRGQGAFVYTDRGGVAHDGTTQLGAAAVDVVLRRRGDTASLWIDGKLVAEAKVPVDRGDLAIGCVGGPARFTGLQLRRL